MNKRVGFFKQTVRGLPLGHGRHYRILIRADYNVPLEDGAVDDDLRIRASLPTLRYLLDKGCSLIIMSHLGRPKGRDMTYSLEPVAQRLQELLQKTVTFVDDITGDAAHQAAAHAGSGDVVLLQNLRFDEREEEDSESFAEEIAHATRADYFVQDGFGVVHRAHTSTHAITLQLPSVAGLLLEKEYMTITRAMEEPERPLVAVLGGAKVSDKIQVVERFVRLADTILIGGAMANTFLDYKDIHVGASKVEADQKETLDGIYRAAHEKVGDTVDDFIVLPSDVAVATKVDEGERRHNQQLDRIKTDEMALDIGDETIEKFQRELGAMGYKYQFITLAGIHNMWYNMFDLAHAYVDKGMTAYVEMVQEREFAAADRGYTFVSHQQEVGAGYFDDLTTVIQGGNSSVTALTGSTEERQFSTQGNDH